MASIARSSFTVGGCARIAMTSCADFSLCEKLSAFRQVSQFCNEDAQAHLARRDCGRFPPSSAACSACKNAGRRRRTQQRLALLVAYSMPNFVTVFIVVAEFHRARDECLGQRSAPESGTKRFVSPRASTGSRRG